LEVICWQSKSVIDLVKDIIRNIWRGEQLKE
jgi:hypothetical protein